MEAGYYIQWCDVLKNASTYLCYFGTDKDTYWGVYDKETSKGWYVHQEKLIDDLGIGQLTRPKTIYQDYFVSFISAENLNEMPDSSILKHYVTSDQMDANPVVLLYKGTSVK